MAKVETLISLEQILEGMRQLSDSEKRTLASSVLADTGLEAFVEELDDHLTCEREAKHGTPQRFDPDEFTRHEV